MSPIGWTFLLKYWLPDRFGATPFEVLASTIDYVIERLPPFYSVLFNAWCCLRGFSASSVLMIGTGAPSGPISVTSTSCKVSYQLLVSLHEVQPHRVLKFAPSFGALDWPATWKSLQFMPLDRQVRDLSWKVLHGVVYTADRLISFGYQYLPSCFCGYHLACSEHLFFSCPLARSGLDWIQSQLFLASPLAPSLTICHVLFGFSSHDLLRVPKVFAYLLNVCKFLVWGQRNDFRFRSKPPSMASLIARMKQRLHFCDPPQDFRDKGEDTCTVK